MHPRTVKIYIPAEHKGRREEVPKAAIRELSTIPSIGPALAADLYLMGIRKVSDLRGRDPQALTDQLSELVGVTADPCVLYTFRCAVYFATEPEPDSEKLKWWYWKDKTE